MKRVIIDLLKSAQKYMMDEMNNLKLKERFYKGKLIVFEGTDGAGKTTLVSMTRQLLESYGKDVISIKQPTDLSRKTKLFQKMMYSENHGDIDYRAVQLLTMSDRIQHNHEVIEPALEAGKIVLCDRYIDTTVEKNRPDANNVYGGIAFLGGEDDDSTQRLYSRIDGGQLFDLSPYSLIYAKFYLPKVGNDDHSLSAYQLGTAWCTLGTTWNNKIDYYKLLKSVRQVKNYEMVEVTDFIGRVMKDNSLRDTGTLLCGGKDKTIVTTGDSCAFPQIIEIRLKSNEFQI